MANNSILTPGCDIPEEKPEVTIEDKYLEIGKCLSEYKTEEQKSVVRCNLNIPSKDSVYTKNEVDTELALKIRDAINQYLTMEDPHGILPQVREMIADMVKTDGSTPFIAPQKGVDPTKDQHLTTKKYVDTLLRKHLHAKDPHRILEEVAYMLAPYVKSSEVYNKDQVYTKQEVDNQSKDYIRNDGTTPFTKAQVGADPQIDSHLATKRYVDKELYAHKVDADPHGYLTLLNQRLGAYAKRKEVYDKTQTYSRSQIDSIINNIVDEAIDLNLREYQDSVNHRLEHIRLQEFVKSDGSVPFKRPQRGIDAKHVNELATLGQIQDAINEVRNDLTEQIENKECVWITSGPVESTVGHLEDNTPVPREMTLQQVCDAIFYGKGVCIEVPDYVIISQSVPVTVCVHASTGVIQYAELYQDDELIHTFKPKDFEHGCTTVQSKPIFKDTEFTFKVYYTSGTIHEVSDTVRCYLPVFVGLLPKFKPAHTVTMDYLIDLCNEDFHGTQNRFLNYGHDLTSFTFHYRFKDPKLRHPFIVVPKDYPKLQSMVTKSQRFGIEAFNIIDEIPLSVPGVEDDIIYTIYVYKEALSSLNQEVTFNFE